MNEDYTQPFYVPIGKGKLNLHTGQRGGYYLPPLEGKEEVNKQPQEIIHRHYNITKQQWDELIQLRRTVSFLIRELNKQSIKKKFPTKYLYSSIIEKGDSK